MRRSINSSLNATMLSPIVAKPAGSPKADSSWRKPGKTRLSREVLKSMAISSRSPSGLNRFVVGKYHLLSTSILNTPLGTTSASPAQASPLSHGAKNHRHRLPTRTRCLIAAPYLVVRHRDATAVQHPTGFSCGSTSIGFVDEDKCGPLHNGRARTNKGDVDIFDLAFTRPA